MQRSLPYKDKSKKVIDALSGYSREEAPQIAEELFGVGSDGKVFEITGRWQTKFNAAAPVSINFASTNFLFKQLIIIN